MAEQLALIASATSARPKKLEIRKHAELSPCGTWRYTLEREWGDATKRVLFCGANPSTADALENDATCRRWFGFASAWGFGAYDAINPYAFRTKSPKVLKRARGSVDLVGPENDEWIAKMAARASLFVCCWGNCAIGIWGFGARWRRVVAIVAEANPALKPHALGMTSKGQPEHVLFLPKDREPFAWEIAP